MPFCYQPSLFLKLPNYGINGLERSLVPIPMWEIAAPIASATTLRALQYLYTFPVLGIVNNPLCKLVLCLLSCV